MGGGKAAKVGIKAAGVRGSGSIMKAITRARAIVARVSGMKDTTRMAAQSDLVEIGATLKQPVCVKE
jgi:hypothetical protein